MPGTMWSTFKFVILFNPQTFYKAGTSINPSLQIKKLKLTETLLKVTQLPSGKAKEQTPDRIPEPKLLNTAPSVCSFYGVVFIVWSFLWDKNLVIESFVKLRVTAVSLSNSLTKWGINMIK